jgi:hypothetical protein
VRGLFFTVIFRRAKKRHRLDTATATPCSASIARNSAKVTSVTMSACLLSILKQETSPRSSRRPREARTYDYDDGCAAFRLAGVMPEGSSFPYDFGFIPSTLGEDGDPLDVPSDT